MPTKHFYADELNFTGEVRDSDVEQFEIFSQIMDELFKKREDKSDADTESE